MGSSIPELIPDQATHVQRSHSGAGKILDLLTWSSALPLRMCHLFIREWKDRPSGFHRHHNRFLSLNLA